MAKARYVHPLSVYYASCKSLNASKLDDLRHNVEKYDPDAICLTETWFTTACQYSTTIPGNTAYTANRKHRIGGGVGRFLRSSTNGIIVKIQTTSIYFAIRLNISHPDMPNVILGGVYHPPSDNGNKNLPLRRTARLKSSFFCNSSSVL